MSETPPRQRKRRSPSAMLAIVGISLMIIGGMWFFNSLGTGGGYLPTILFSLGAIVTVIAIVNALIKVLR